VLCKQYHLFDRNVKLMVVLLFGPSTGQPADVGERDRLEQCRISDFDFKRSDRSRVPCQGLAICRRPALE